MTPLWIDTGQTKAASQPPHSKVAAGPLESSASDRRPLKVCVITNSLRVGGAETQLLRMCQHVDPRRVALEVVYYGRRHELLEEFRRTPATITFIDKNGLGKLRFILRLAGHLRNGGYDVVHTWLGTANQYGVLAAILAGRRCILTGHRSLDPPSGPRRWFDRTMARFTAGRVVNSHAIAACHSQRTGYPAGKIMVLHNGIDPAEFAHPRPRRDVRRELGVPEAVPLIVSVGRLEKVKNQMLFIRMAGGVTRRGYDARFAILGEGPDQGMLQEAATAAGLGQTLQFLGVRRDMADVLAASDVSVCTSPEEGLPNVVLEAMSMGVPVVTTDNGGGPELLDNPEQVVPAGNEEALIEKVAFVLDHSDVAAQWAQRAQRRAQEEFHVEVAAARYADLLWRVAGRGLQPR